MKAISLLSSRENRRKSLTYCGLVYDMKVGQDLSDVLQWKIYSPLNLAFSITNLKRFSIASKKQNFQIDLEATKYGIERKKVIAIINSFQRW